MVQVHVYCTWVRWQPSVAGLGTSLGLSALAVAPLPPQGLSEGGCCQPEPPCPPARAVMSTICHHWDKTRWLRNGRGAIEGGPKGSAQTERRVL